MFRRCSDNDRWTGGYLSQTTSFSGDHGSDCDEHRRRGSSRHDARDADDGGHGHNPATGTRWVHRDASRHRDAARGDDGCGRSRRRGSASDVGDSADHRSDDDDADARQAGDG